MIIAALLAVWCCSVVKAETTKLLAEDGYRDDRYGETMAASNGYLLVGAPADDGGPFDERRCADCGRVHVYEINTMNRVRTFAPGGHYDYFGKALSVHGTIAAIGADTDDYGDNSGSVYLYNIATGEFMRKLKASDAGSRHYFGDAVAINDRYVVVGAPDGNGATTLSGAAYVFDLSTGAEHYKLISDDGVAGNNFGASVAVNDEFVFVGEPNKDGESDNAGAGYIFDLETGNQVLKLSVDRGRFGSAAAMSSEFLAVSAPSGSVSITQKRGTVYIYSATTFELLHKLKLANRRDKFGRYESGDASFGHSLAMSGSIICIGSPWEEIDDVARAGAVYVYSLNTGELLHQLVAEDSDIHDLLGFSVAAYEDVAFGGIPFDDDNGDAAGAILFSNMAGLDFDGDGCTNETERLTQTDPLNPNERLRFWLSASGDDILTHYAPHRDGLEYELMHSPMLQPDSWQTSDDLIFTGSSEERSTRIAQGAVDISFFRLRVQQADAPPE